MAFKPKIEERMNDFPIFPLIKLIYINGTLFIINLKKLKFHKRE